MLKEILKIGTFKKKRLNYCFVSTGTRLRSGGFTIVELLIVIVVIAILAAITIVSYNGITQNAIETSMKADLRNAANSVESDSASNNGYPSNASTVNGGQGLKPSGSNTLSYTVKPYGYCVASTNPKTSKQFVFKSNNPTIVEGSCQAVASLQAGASTNGNVNGASTVARFNYPNDVAVDANGTIYVADASNNAIRRISTSGDVTTLAGTGAAGFADGPGSSAQFNYPSGIGLDKDGNVYVADLSNRRIRKITVSGTTGTVSTIAGSGTSGYMDGTGTGATFANPRDVAVDSQGFVYAIETLPYPMIRKISPSGQVVTVAGGFEANYVNGQGTASRFRNLQGIVVGEGDTVYVTDNTDNRIRRMTSSGYVDTYAGSGTSGNLDGSATTARFSQPSGIAIDRAGTLYVSELGVHDIRSIASNGSVATVIGGVNAGYVEGPSAQFYNPSGITVDSAGILYVADRDNQRIRKVTP